MYSINLSSVTQFTKTVRDKYPTAVLGFLGNSLAISAIADRQASNNVETREQYIISFSGDCFFNFVYEEIQESFKSGHYTYRYSNAMKEERLKECVAAVEKSAISPKSIISENKHLVVIDRVVEAKSLASYGYVWTLAAEKQGYSQLEVAQHLELCAFPEVEDDVYKDFKIMSFVDEKMILSAKFEQFTAMPRSLFQDILTLDDKRDNNQEHIRLVPRNPVKYASSKKDDIANCYQIIENIYIALEENRKILPLDFSDKRSEFVPNTFSDKIAGLIIQ